MRSVGLPGLGQSIEDILGGNLGRGVSVCSLNIFHVQTINHGLRDVRSMEGPRDDTNVSFISTSDADKDAPWTFFKPPDNVIEKVSKDGK